MARSKRFVMLVLQLRKLREHLLPQKFEPTGTYSARKLKRAVAYRVLAHAEFEAYFEDRVKEIALSALKKWKKINSSSTVLMGLLAFAGREMEGPPPSLEPPQANQAGVWETKKRLDKRLDLVAAAFFHIIEQNNGIKEVNLLKLLLPIGFPVDKLDPVWLADMNSFGAARGQFAHSSATTVLDPEDELKKVVNLLAGVQQIDRDMNRLK